MNFGKVWDKVLWEYISGVRVDIGRDWGKVPCAFGSCANFDKDCGIGF